MSANAVKFETVTLGNIYFTQEEIPVVNEFPSQNIMIHQNMIIAPFVQVYNDQYMQFDFSVNETNYDTVVKVDNVLSLLEEFIFYPALLAQPTKKYNVVIVPSEITRTWFYGRPEAMRMTTFKMIESSK